MVLNVNTSKLNATGKPNMYAKLPGITSLECCGLNLFYKSDAMSVFPVSKKRQRYKTVKVNKLEVVDFWLVVLLYWVWVETKVDNEGAKTQIIFYLTWVRFPVKIMI